MSLHKTHGLWFIFLTLLILAPLVWLLQFRGTVKTYDSYPHLFRMAAFHRAILDGQIPPRWSSQLAYGFGSPVFHYNWSLPYWMAEPFLFAGLTVTQTLNIVIALITVFSFGTMFAFLMVWIGSIWPAIVGATLYVWSLFSIYLMYTAGGLGMEAGLMTWPILFLSSIYAARNRMPKAVLLGSIGVGLTMLSHQVMFLMIMPLWFIFVGILTRKSKTNTVLRSAFFSLVLGLGLTAYFWIPAFTETGAIHISRTAANYVRDFLPFSVLFLQPGIAHLAGDFWYFHIYATGWIPWLIVAMVATSRPFVKKLSRISPVNNPAHFGWLFLGFFFLAQFLITSYSRPLWHYFPLLSSFIYPVRFQALASFCTSTLAAFIIVKTKPMWLTSLSLIVLTLLLNVQAIPPNPERINWPDTHYYYGDSTGDVMGEFLPRWTDTDHFFGKGRWARYPLARVLSGQATFSAVTKKSDRFSFSANVTEPSTVIINQLYWPLWKITVDGQDTTISVTTLGEMTIALPPGTHEISGRIAPTFTTWFASWVSVASGIILLTFLLALRSSMRKRTRIFSTR